MRFLFKQNHEVENSISFVIREKHHSMTSIASEIKKFKALLKMNQSRAIIIYIYIISQHYTLFKIQFFMNTDNIFR